MSQSMFSQTNSFANHRAAAPLSSANPHENEQDFNAFLEELEKYHAPTFSEEPSFPTANTISEDFPTVEIISEPVVEKDIDQLSRKVPCLCKLAPNTQKYSVQECNRAGGILGILNELNKGGLINGAVKRVDGKTLDEQMKKYDITGAEIDPEADRIYLLFLFLCFCSLKI